MPCPKMCNFEIGLFEPITVEMRRYITSILILAAMALSPAVAKSAVVSIPASDSLVTRIGRTMTTADGAVCFNWSATTFCVRFSGRQLSLRAGDTAANWFNVWVDKAPCAEPDMVFVISSADSVFVLADKLGKGEHQVCIQRRTEGRAGDTTFRSFSTDGSFLQARPVKSRLIEFIGDSLTCGYGDEGLHPKERYKLDTENSAKTYAAILGRYFDADVVTVCHSGMGVARNVGDKMPNIYMDTLYGRVMDAKEKEDMKGEYDDVVWDPSTLGAMPQLTVIYLGANDFSGGRQPGLASFTKHYLNLIGEVRKNYGESHPILCVAYNRQPMLYYYITEAVRQLKNVSCVALSSSVMHLDARNLGSASHPNYKGQIKYAYALIPYVSTITGWEVSEPAF